MYIIQKKRKEKKIQNAAQTTATTKYTQNACGCNTYRHTKPKAVSRSDARRSGGRANEFRLPAVERKSKTESEKVWKRGSNRLSAYALSTVLLQLDIISSVE